MARYASKNLKDLTVGIASFSDNKTSLNVIGHTELHSVDANKLHILGSGDPSISSPNNLNLNAVNVAISTNATVGGDFTVNGNVSIAGTLTYEDVTNIDSIGLITARSGLIVSGVSTFSSTVDINGDLDVDRDVTINGLTVGRGAADHIANTAIGNNALASNTNGDNNTANGYRALYKNTTGHSNTANGVNALYTNDTGNYNTATGANALDSNTTGSWNTATGPFALYYNTTGYYNTATGSNALRSNTTGEKNVAIGYQAGYYIEGSNNTIIGGYKGTSADSSLSGTVIISAGTTERLRINSDGNVIVGGGLTVSGVSTFSSAVDVNDSLSILGSGDPSISSPNNLNLNAVNVAISTNATVGGNLNVSGVSTFASIDVNGHTELDTVNVSGVVTATSFSGDGSNLTNIVFNLVDDTTPQLGGNLDTNGREIISTNNLDIEFIPDGGGKVVFAGVSNNGGNGAGRFKLNCEQNSHGITIQGPPHSAAANYTLTLPDNDGSAGTYLKSDGSGNLSWDTPSGSGGSGISSVFEDTTPQLGGNLDLNNKDITGDGNVNLTGDGYFSGDLSLGNYNNPTIDLNGSSGDAKLIGTIKLGGNVSTPNITLFKSGDSTFAGVITATKFVGDGSGLTGVVSSGSGVVIQHDGSNVGTASTINFSTNLDVTPISAGIVTVTASGGGGGGGLTASKAIAIAMIFG